MKIVICIFMLFLWPTIINIAEFMPCPVYEHIQIHGHGIDMSSVWGQGKANYQLRKKNFKPGRYLRR